MQIFWVLALGFAIFVATFAVQNAGAITVRLLAWEWETSAAVVVLGSAAAGALVAGLLGTVRQVSLSLRLRNLQSRFSKLEKELEKRGGVEQSSGLELDVSEPIESTNADAEEESEGLR